MAQAQAVPAVQQLIELPGDIYQIAVDKSGQIYLAGRTFAPNFPVTSNAFQSTLAGGGFYPQGFLAKLDPTGSRILYATFLSGLATTGLAVDDSGFMYVMANHAEPAPEDVAFDYPASLPFPISSAAAQTQPAFPTSLVLAKFAPTGELVYSTYVGGATSPYDAHVTGSNVGAIAVDSGGAATVCGSTMGQDLPTNGSSFQPLPGGGWDAYIVRVSADGTAFEAATYLGGASDDFCDDIEPGADGNYYVYGATTSNTFPLTSNAVQAPPSPYGNVFVTAIDPQFSHVIWSTRAPGRIAQRLAFDQNGDVLIFGGVDNTTFPGSAGSPWTCCTQTFFGEVFDATSRQLVFSQTLAPGNIFGQPMTVDSAGNVYFAAPSGPFMHPNSTLNAGASPGGALLARFNSQTRTLTYLGPVPNVGFDETDTTLVPVAFDSQNQKLLLAGSVHGGASAIGGGGALVAADFSGELLPSVIQASGAAWPATSQVSPGDLIEVGGLGLGPAQMVSYNPSTGPVSTLAQTSVLFDGMPAALVSANETSVLVLAPASLTPGNTTALVVQNAGASSVARSVPVVAANPILATAAGTETGQADAMNPDGTSNSSQQPVRKGENIRLYATGLGAVGASNDASSVSATVSELTAQVVDIGPAAGRAPGQFQIDVVVPNGVPESDLLLVQIQVNGVMSQNGVTLAVR